MLNTPLASHFHCLTLISISALIRMCWSSRQLVTDSCTRCRPYLSAASIYTIFAPTQNSGVSNQSSAFVMVFTLPGLCMAFTNSHRRVSKLVLAFCLRHDIIIIPQTRPSTQPLTFADLLLTRNYKKLHAFRSSDLSSPNLFPWQYELYG